MKFNHGIVSESGGALNDKRAMEMMMNVRDGTGILAIVFSVVITVTRFTTRRRRFSRLTCLTAPAATATVPLPVALAVVFDSTDLTDRTSTQTAKVYRPPHCTL